MEAKNKIILMCRPSRNLFAFQLKFIATVSQSPFLRVNSGKPPVAVKQIKCRDIGPISMSISLFYKLYFFFCRINYPQK